MDIKIVVFDPHHWTFELGSSLNRYVEHDKTHKWIRKELCLGLLVISVRVNWIFKLERLPQEA
jgi:hypothetical protein